MQNTGLLRGNLFVIFVQKCDIFNVEVDVKCAAK